MRGGFQPAFELKSIRAKVSFVPFSLRGCAFASARRVAAAVQFAYRKIRGGPRDGDRFWRMARPRAAFRSPRRAEADRSDWRSRGGTGLFRPRGGQSERWFRVRRAR